MPNSPIRPSINGTSLDPSYGYLPGGGYDFPYLGRGGPVLIYGSDAGDQIDLSSIIQIVGGGVNTIYAGDGSDLIKSSQIYDNIYGEGGDDVISVYRAGGVFSGGDGDDTISFSASSMASTVSFDGGAGNDTLNIISSVSLDISGLDITNFELGTFNLGYAQYYGPNVSLTLTPDQLTELASGPADDLLAYGRSNFYTAGDIDLFGSGGASFYGYTISGVFNLSDDGNNLFLGGATIDGQGDTGAKPLIVNGGSSDDYVEVGSSEDSLRSGFYDSEDYLYGNGGNDVLILKNHFKPALLDGGDGNDILTGGETSTLTGDAGDDQLTGGPGDQSLDGGDGDDVLDGGLSYFRPPSDPDVAVFDGSFRPDGDDTLDGGDGDDDLNGRAGNDILTGGAGNDVLNGGNTENYSYLYKSVEYQVVDPDGADNLMGGAGNDQLIGGPGADIMNGGDGDDLFLIDAGSDVVSGEHYTGGAGLDVILVATADDVDLSPATIDPDVEGLVTLPDLAPKISLTAAQLDQFTIIDAAGTIALTTAGAVNLNRSLTVQAARFDLGASGNALSLSGHIEQNYLVEGGSGNDVVTGGDDGNRLDGNGGADHLVGGIAADDLDGGAGNDVIVGGAGNDVLIGGVGRDVLIGDDGDDSFEILAGGDVAAGEHYSGGGGANKIDVATDDKVNLSLAVIDADIAHLTTGEFAPEIQLKAAQLANFFFVDVGGALDLTTAGVVDLSGAFELDVPTFNLSSDGNTLNLGHHQEDHYVVNGGKHNDVIIGGDAGDTFIGNAGDDQLTGGTNGDNLQGGIGNDMLIGGTGDDTLTGGAGRDVVSGGDGNDHIYILAASDVVTGENYIGGAGVDTLDIDTNDAVNLTHVMIGTDIERLVSDTFAPKLIDLTTTQLTQFATIDVNGAIALTNAGAVDLSHTRQLIAAAFDLSALGNSLNLAGHKDLAYLVQGGAGKDTVRGGDAGNQIQGGGGDDVLAGGAGNDLLDGGTGNDTADYGNATAAVTVSLMTAAAQASGGAGVDMLLSIETLAGTRFNDTLSGGLARDALHGQAGNDLLVSGSGADLLDGGAGIDTASYVDATAAVLVKLATTTAQNTHGGGVDTLSGIENLTGSAFDDNLSGDAGNNLLSGGTGNDTLLGGTGNDALNGGSGIDTASYLGAAAGVAVDLSLKTAQDTHGAGVDTLLLVENLRGSAFDDMLTGNAVANLINGAEGNDVILGNGGNDGLVGGIGDDVLSGGGGQDRIDGGDGNNIVGGDAGNDSLTSGNGDDVLHGGDGNDLIDGGAGNDVLHGDGGRDRLTGGLGADMFVFTAASDSTPTITGRDTIADFSHADGDRIDVSGIDAVTGGSDDAFTFLGGAAFDHQAGEMRVATSGANFLVQADVNGDGIADFAVLVTSATPLVAGDFIL